MAFPPSGLIVYTPLDVTPSWYSRAQRLGSSGWRKIWFESYAWTTVKVIYFYLVMGVVFLLIMNDYYVCKIPTTTTITTTKEIYWEEGLINKYRSCVHLVLELWKHCCAGFLCFFFFALLFSLTTGLSWVTILANASCTVGSRKISTAFNDTEESNCFSLYHTDTKRISQFITIRSETDCWSATMSFELLGGE